MPGDAELSGRRRAAAGPAPAAVAGRTPPAGGPGPTPEGAPRQRRSGAGGRLLVRLALVGGAVALVATGAARTDFSQPLVSTAAPVLALGAVAVALALLAALWATAWRRAAALFTLLVAGQAAALRLIDAPRYAAYQHVLPLARLLGAAALPCAVVLLQAAACLVLALRWWRPALRAAATPGGITRLALIALLMPLVLAVPTASAFRFGAELVVSAIVAAAGALNLWLIADALPAAGLAGAVRWLEERLTLPGSTDAAPGAPRRWDRRFPLVVAGIVTVTAALVSVFVLERLPHIDDSVAYLFQAKYLSRGRLWLPPPPDSAAFAGEHLLVHGGRWFSKYFPGWPLVLALGVPAGVPWLVNPLLGGAAVLLAHGWLRRLTDRGVANATIALLAMSPWLIFTSASLMAHPLSLALALATLLAVELGYERRRDGWFALAGLAAGGVFLTRPLEAVALAAVVGARMLLPLRRRLPWRALAIVGASAAVAALPYFVYNHVMTGRWTYAPYTLYSDLRYGPGVDVLGFGPKVGIPDWRNLDPLPGHGPADVILNANKNLFMINADLFGWASGSLILVLAALLFPGRRPGDRLLLWMVAAVMGVHSFFWFSGGPDLGARFWYLAIVPLGALSIRGVQRLAAVPGPGAAGRTLSRLAAMLVAASLAAGLTVLPWRAATKYWRYRGIGGEVRALVRQRGIRQALVFVRSPARSDWQQAFVLNPPTLADAGTVFARDAGPASRARVAAAFPGRPVWIIGRANESAPFAVLESPAPSDSSGRSPARRPAPAGSRTAGTAAGGR